MSSFWIATIGTSVIAFLLKFAGHSVPERWLSHPKIQRINILIPIALLSAIVATINPTNRWSITTLVFVVKL